MRAAGGAGTDPRGVCVETPDEWVAAIRRLAGDADCRRRMGRAGQAYVPKVHDRVKLADRLAELWRRVAARDQA